MVPFFFVIMTIVVRNCPSPTGSLHLGTVRTALYNYLYAKQQGGTMLFRSEDTDRERSTKEYEQNIIEGLLALGLLDPETLNADNTPQIKQSERTEMYRKKLEELLANGHAYYCFCTREELDKERETQIKNKLPPKYSGRCRPLSLQESKERITKGEKAVIRLKVPEQKTLSFQDLIRGTLSIESKELADFVIAKDLDTPLYNFVVVIDDHDMNITHVLRGEDHISNTPKQLLVYEACGWNPPVFAHLPLILNQDKSKLSKRKNKVSMADYLQEGFLPEAMINFLALLGWNTSDEQEIFSLEELVEKFSLERVHKGGAIFDMTRLEWINSRYIRQLSPEELTKKVTPYFKEIPKDLQKYVVLIQQKMKKLSEAPELLSFFFKETLEYDPSLFIHEKMKVTKEIAKKALEVSLSLFESIDTSQWTEETLKEQCLQKVQELGWKNGQLLWPIRVALTGEQFSPGAFEVAAVLGKETSMQRVKRGLQKITS